MKRIEFEFIFSTFKLVFLSKTPKMSGGATVRTNEQTENYLKWCLNLKIILGLKLFIYIHFINISSFKAVEITSVQQFLYSQLLGWQMQTFHLTDILKTNYFFIQTFKGILHFFLEIG